MEVVQDPVATEPAGLPAQDKPLPMQVFREGLAYLRGTEGSQDHGMAAARLLDASDLGHPMAHFYSALLYFCGVGVTRNTQSAAEYARRYLATESAGPFAGMANELVDGSLGTENARRVLLEGVRPGEVSAPAAAAAAKKKSPVLVIGAVGVVLVLAGAAAFFALRPGGVRGLESPAGIKLESLLPADDVEQARREARTLAASMQSSAQALLQERKAAEEAQAKAEQERAEREAEQQRQAQEAQARAEQARAAAEAQARAEAEARAAQRQQAGRSTQMLLAARDLIRQGELDRASGILDAVLAIEPSNQDAMQLKQYIKQARQRAINSIQVR